MKLSILIDRFLLSMRGVHSSKLVVWYRSLLRRMMTHIGDKPISQVKLGDLRARRAALAETGVSSWTLNAACRAARRLFAFATAEGLGHNAAAAGIRPHDFA